MARVPFSWWQEYPLSMPSRWRFGNFLCIYTGLEPFRWMNHRSCIESPGAVCVGMPWCRGACVPHIHAHAPGCHPPLRGGRCRGAVGLASHTYMHRAVTPPLGDAKKRGGMVAAPPGCMVHFWFLFIPPRLRMVARVSAMSSGV